MAPLPNFYPRSPRGERPMLAACKYGALTISIHALLAESDCASCDTSFVAFLFLSTLSSRRATCLVQVRAGQQCISIHALLAESDCSDFILSTFGVHFYPRSPRGERPDDDDVEPVDENFYPRSPRGERRSSNAQGAWTRPFLSTLSSRRAT